VKGAWSILFVAASIAWDCGGIAVIDGGSGGASSGSAGSGTQGQGGNTNTKAANTATSSASTAGGGGLCQSVCDQIDECMTDPADCVALCSDETLCVSTQRALLNCLLEEANPDYPCDLPDACIVSAQAYRVCIGSGSITGTCPDEDVDCDCSVADSMGNTFVTQCDAVSGGTRCDCFLNTSLEGTCTTPAQGAECSPLDDCCATLLLVPW
jgi:hypothetical protein